MIKDFTSKIIALICLLIGSYGVVSARVVEVPNSKNVISTSTTANTEAFRGNIDNFDFSKMSFRAVINVDDATDGANLLTLSNAQISTASSNYYSIQNGIHIYYAKSKVNWRNNASLTNVVWVDIIQNSGDWGIAVYKENVTGNVVIELKADGLYINGERILRKDQNVGGKNINPLIATGSKTLYYSWAEGSTRSTATYKEIAITGTLKKTISFNVLDEDSKKPCAVLLTGSKSTNEAKVDLDNAIMRFKLDITNCTGKSGTDNYNLLNIGTSQCNGGWGTGSGMGYGVHVYYRRQSSTLEATGSKTYANGVLWFDEVLNNNGGDARQQGIVDAPANNLIIELRKDGIYVNDVNKIPSTTSGLSNLFTGGTKTIYYSNNEGGDNQTSQATYEISVIPMVTLDGYLKEGEDNSEQCLDGAADKVKIERTLVTGNWNTFCVPFGIDNAQFKNVYGSGTEICKLGNVNGNVLNFDDCSNENIKAGVPYLVKPAQVKANPTFTNVTFAAAEPIAQGASGGVQMVGIYSPKTLNTDGTHLFIVSGGKFKKPTSATQATMKGMRAYFIVPSETDASKLSSRFGGVETAIAETFVDAVRTADNRVFNLQGQMVGTSLNGLPAGLYIQNGKKVLVRK